MSTTILVAKAAGLLMLFSLVVGCGLQRDDFLEDVLALQPPTDREQGPSEAAIEEIEAAIERYRDIVEARVEAARNLAVYYKMLASEYIERSMFGLAIDALEEAIAIQPENPTLFYTAGVSAGRYAKAHTDSEESNLWLERAEAYYVRCLELDPRYDDAYYGLAVLYEFELGRSAEARDLLEELVAFRPSDYRALGLLARIYVGEGRVTDALNLYEEIAANSKDPELRRQATENRRRLLGEVP